MAKLHCLHVFLVLLSHAILRRLRAFWVHRPPFTDYLEFRTTSHSLQMTRIFVANGESPKKNARNTAFAVTFACLRGPQEVMGCGSEAPVCRWFVAIIPLMFSSSWYEHEYLYFCRFVFCVCNCIAFSMLLLLFKEFYVLSILLTSRLGPSRPPK